MPSVLRKGLYNATAGGVNTLFHLLCLFSKVKASYAPKLQKITVSRNPRYGDCLRSCLVAYYPTDFLDENPILFLLRIHLYHYLLQSLKMEALTAEQALSLNSTIQLSSGHDMPLLGLGVYRNTGPTVISACLAAFEKGYRHIDSAKLYANEREVGEAVSKTGLKREDVFISTP